MRGFVFGLGSGFLVGLICAPRSGSETRRALSSAFASGNPSRPAASKRGKEATANDENSPFLIAVNEWTQERLIEVSGIGPVLAEKIIQNRPYRSEDAFTEAKLVPPVALEGLRRAV